jgi:hypothetical protein
MMPTWEKVYLVADRGEGVFEVIELEGRQIHDEIHDDWIVNVRGPGCTSKQLETVPGPKVHRARESAEARAAELRAQRRDCTSQQEGGGRVPPSSLT